MQRLRHRGWLWVVMGLAVAVAFVVVLQPAFSADTPASLSPKGNEAEQLAQPYLSQPASVRMETQLASSSEPDQNPVTLIANVPSSDNCIICHPNKEILQQLAKEPEETKSELAEGEG